MFKWSDFFLGQALALDFPVLCFYWNNCQRVTKLFRLWTDCFCSFSVGMCFVSSRSFLHGLKTARISKLWFYFDDMNFFSVFSLSGFMVCSLLASEFSNTDSLALPKQYKTNSCNCATSGLVLWQKMMKQLFLYFWKPNISFSGFFPILTVFWCSIPFFAIVFFSTHSNGAYQNS